MLVFLFRKDKNMIKITLTTEQAELLRLFLLGTAVDAGLDGQNQRAYDQIIAVQEQISKKLNKNVDMPEVKLANIPW